MARIERQALLKRFHAMIRKGQPIVGGGAGTGLSAKCEEAGGIDLIVIYNSGRYRMAGRGSLAGLLAYGNANEIVLEMAREVLPVVERTPVLAGVNGTDPFCIFDDFLDAAEGARLLRHPELSDRRPDRRRLSRQPRGDRHGLRPRGRPRAQGARPGPFDDALRVRRGRCPRHDRGGRRHRGRAYGPHRGRLDRRRDRGQPGRTACRASRRSRRRRAACATTSSCSATAARSPRPRMRRIILARCENCHGFYGASSMERLPTEVALTERTRSFKAIERPRAV